MMAATKGVGAIEFHLDLRMHRPFRYIDQRRASTQHLQGPKVPLQQLDLKPWSSIGKPDNKIPQSIGRPSTFLPLANERYPGVKIPTDQHDSLLSVHHRLLDNFEIVSSVDNHLSASCTGNPQTDDVWLSSVANSDVTVLSFQSARSVRKSFKMSSSADFIGLSSIGGDHVAFSFDQHPERLIMC